MSQPVTFRRMCLALIGLVLLALLPATVAAGPVSADVIPPTAYVPGEIVLAWEPDAAAVQAWPALAQQPQSAAGPSPVDRTTVAWREMADALAALTGLEVREALPERSVAALAVMPGREQAESSRLAQLPWVRYAEPNYVYRATGIDGEARYPTDPSFGLQWNMRRVAGPDAWAVTRGSYGVTVAVVDSGVDRGHPEFQGRLAQGYDFINDDYDQQDDYGHGTHVAGILAAAADNGQGVSGLAPDVQLLPYKALDAQGNGDALTLAIAIYAAANANAQIINLSLGGPYPSSPIADAVQYATGEKHALVVAAGGNCAQGGPACSYIANGDFYPAAYDYVLAVAAGDHFDNWARYSNHRPYIDLAAPGGIAGDAIYSTRPGGYGYMSGTSMAAPLVSAAAALVWGIMPAPTADQVAAILRDTADKIGTDPDTGVPYAYNGGRNDYFGYGRLNVGRAVRWAQPPALRTETTAVRFALGGVTPAASQRMELRNPSDQVVVWQASVVQGQSWLSVQPASNTTRYDYPSSLTLRAGPSLPGNGIYYGLVRVQAVYPAGIAPVDIPVELVVRAFARQTYLPGVARQAATWYDPAVGGRRLWLGNNQATEEVLPFPVMFFGAAHTRLWVSDNGLVYFGGEQPRATLPPSACPPTAAQPNNALHVLALDWDPGLGGQISVLQPDADTFVVTWDQVRRAGNPQPQSFQLVLRRDAAPLAYYRTVETLPPGYIAAENYDGTYAQQVFCAGAGRAPVNGMVVTFDVRTPW